MPELPVKTSLYFNIPSPLSRRFNRVAFSITLVSTLVLFGALFSGLLPRMILAQRRGGHSRSPADAVQTMRAVDHRDSNLLASALSQPGRFLDQASSHIVALLNQTFFPPQRTDVAKRAAPSFEFTFNAFGDSAWADSHVGRPVLQHGFKTAYLQFDPQRQFIGDINYVNWETTVGRVCSQFWAPPSETTFAFMTRPEELRDAVSLGFNLIGLANNHSYDCVQSPEGVGPLQTISHLLPILAEASEARSSLSFSGVYGSGFPPVSSVNMRLKAGTLPVLFVSAYVGGDPQHCASILCLDELGPFAHKLFRQPGLRVLALHSWDPSSHARLKDVLAYSLIHGFADVAVGTGPHVGETIQRVATPRGDGLMVTSLGNFIHPGLSGQPNNILLRSKWRYQPSEDRLHLLALSPIQISCDGASCRQGPSYPVSAPSP